MIYSSTAKQHDNNSAERRFKRAYNVFYDALLKEISPTTFLELGISRGNNLTLWTDILKTQAGDNPLYSLKIGVELLNPSQTINSLTGDSFAKQLDECKEAFNKYLDYGSENNNKWYFGWDAFAIETVLEIVNNHGKLDLIINDARHGSDVWKMLDIWKDALSKDGIIITEEIGCATRQQVPEGELINKQQVNQALKEGWQIYNFNNKKTWEQPNCLVGYWSQNKLKLEELNEYRIFCG